MPPAGSRPGRGGDEFDRGAAIKEERGGRFQHVLAQLFPRIGFGEDAFGEAFGAIAVRLLDNLERQFWHMFMIRHVFARAGRTSHDSSAGGKLDPVNGRDEEIRLDPTRDGQTLAPTIALT
jgi:hypothetical protein